MRKLFSVILALLCFGCFPAMAEGTTYINPETGYRAVLEDDIDLLTEEEETTLMETMEELTQYTNVAFWSTRAGWNQSSAIRNAENKHISLFGPLVNGIVFMIDMDARYMFLDTEGWIQGVIPKSTAEIITNNVRSAMSAGRYYEASDRVYKQVRAKINGEKIAEPMRYLSAVSIGIMGGLLFALYLTLTRRNRVNPVRYPKEVAAKAVITTITVSNIAYTLQGEPTVKRIYSPPHDSSSSGGSSCSSCSSGSSCSSCSSGSSCGGGSSF